MSSKAPQKPPELLEPEDVLQPGTTLLRGQYRIEKYLAAGGFGITYTATDSLEQRVVIKECYPEAICSRDATRVVPNTKGKDATLRTFVDLFIREARNLARLSHPNIVRVHQVFEDYQTAYMAMDYIEGDDLLTISEGSRSIQPAMLERMIVKLLGAIQFMHDAGILHRDIAPDNILLTPTGEPILIDFGAARETVTRATRLLGTMRAVKDGYSPHELYVADSDQYPSSDLYALAASLYHLITGAPPPNAQERMWAVVRKEPDPYVPIAGTHPEYSDDFLDCIDHALAVRPDDRIQSATEWRDRLGNSSIAVFAPTRETVPILAVSNTPKRKTQPRPVAPQRVEPGTTALTPRREAQEADPLNQPETPSAPTPEDDTDPPIELAARARPPRAFLWAGAPAAAAIAAIGFFSFNGAMGTPDAAPEIAATQPAAEIAPSPAIASPTLVAGISAEDTPPAPPSTSTFADPELAGLSSLAPAAPEQDEISRTAPIQLAALDQVMPEVAIDMLMTGFASWQEAHVLPVSSKPTVVESLRTELAGPGEVAQSGAILMHVSQAPERKSFTKSSLRPTLPTADATPIVFTVAPKPLPKKLASDETVSAFTVKTSKVVSFPVLPNLLEPTRVLMVGGAASDQILPGEKIITVNGAAISSIGDVPRIVSETSDYEVGQPVLVRFGVEDATGDTSIRDLTLTSVFETALENGVVFHTARDGDKWITTVSRGTGDAQTDLLPGDRIVSLMPMKEPIDTQDALASALRREIRNGAASFSFAIERNGALWFVSMPYAPTAAN